MNRNLSDLQFHANYGTDTVTARHPEHGYVGSLKIRRGGSNNGEIERVEVLTDWQRKGVGTELLNQARKAFPTANVRHSTNLSPAGRAWSEARP